MLACAVGNQEIVKASVGKEVETLIRIVMVTLPR